MTFNYSSWTVLSSIEQVIKNKIEKIGKPLKEWDIKINYGIKTGYNEAFIIDGLKREELIKKCPEADSIIRPILLGKNIKRYKYEWTNLWVIFTRRGIVIDDYPAIKEYLYQYYEELKPRNNNELTGRKAGSYEWFHIQDNVAYYKDFEKPKIAWGNLALQAQFSIVESGFYINAPSAFIATENNYLLAILNSKVADYYIRQLGVSRNGGYFEYKPMFVEKIPVPNVSQDIQDEFDDLVKQILNCKKNNLNTLDIEQQINSKIYTILEFNEVEINYMESINDNSSIVIPHN